MMTKEQYIESLRKLHLNLYRFGEKVENVVDDPVVRPSLNSFAATYELAEDPQYEDLMTATSSLTGRKINRFTHLHQSADDLIKKVKMQRLLGQKTAACPRPSRRIRTCSCTLSSAPRTAFTSPARRRTRPAT